MFGGLAISNNLLCVAYSDARGKVFLIDLEDRRPLSFFEFAGDGGFADAGGIAIDDAFTVWLADTKNDLVRRFTLFGKQIGTLGTSSDASAHAVRRDRPGVLNRPRAVAVHGDVVHVACGEGKLIRGVQRFARDGTPLAPLLGFGESEARFGAPRGLYADARVVLVADTLHGVIQRFTAAGRYIGSFPSGRTREQNSRPLGVIALADHSIVVADGGEEPALRRFSQTGVLRDQVLAGQDWLHEPVGLAADQDGRIYVLDRDGERVQRLRPDLRHDTLVLDLAEFLYGQG